MKSTLFGLLLCAIFLLPSAVMAQYWEVGVAGGVSSYQGDIPVGHMGLARFQAAGGLWLRYQMNPWFSARFFANRAVLSARDPLPGSGASAVFRNLHMRTPVTEAGVLYEVSLGGFSHFDGRRLVPVVYTGFQMLHFNPRARFQGEWMDLQPLGTEGQTMYGGRAYQRLHPAIPVGLGFRWGMSPRVSLALDVAARFTFTDYLDDVSGAYPDLQSLYLENPMAARLSDRAAEVHGAPPTDRSGSMRGDPRTMDRYFLSTLSLSVHLGRLSRMEFDPAFKPFLP